MSPGSGGGGETGPRHRVVQGTICAMQARSSFHCMDNSEI